MSKRYQDEDWLRQQFIEANLTTKQVAEKCDVSPTTIRKYVRRFDIATKPYQREDWLRTRLIDRDMEAREVAEEANCTYHTISKWADKFDIDWKNEEDYEKDWLRKKIYKEGKRPFQIAEELGIGNDTNIADYCNQFFGCSAAYKDQNWVQKKIEIGWNDKDLAEHCGVSPATIRKWLDIHGIEHNFSEQKATGKIRDTDWLEQQYHEGLSSEEIAEKCNYSLATVCKWANELEVDTRAKWQKESWLRPKIESGLRYNEIGDEVDKNRKIIRYGVKKAGLKRLYYNTHDIEEGKSRGKVEIKEDTLVELFVRRKWTYEEIAEHLGTSPYVVNRRLRDYGLNQKLQPVPIYVTKESPNSSGNSGYVEWIDNHDHCSVHRLIMVAEHGLEAVKDMHVHHKSVTWDNRPEAMELLTPEEHREIEEWPDEREIHEVPRPPDPDQKKIDDCEPQDPLAF